jgi:hypothetical protein
VFELCRAVGVISFVWVAIGCILKWGMGACSSSVIGRDCTGVVFGSMGLYRNGVCGFWGLAEAWVVTIFLAVLALGYWAPGKVFLYPAKPVAHCN